MTDYEYEQLKRVAKQAKEEFAKKGILLEKSSRIKPINRQKERLIYMMVVDRIEKYPPKKKESYIVLPYY